MVGVPHVSSRDIGLPRLLSALWPATGTGLGTEITFCYPFNKLHSEQVNKSTLSHSTDGNIAIKAVKKKLCICIGRAFFMLYLQRENVTN